MSDSRRARIKALFGAACELAPGRRNEFLRDACGEDCELIEAVEALLAHEQRDDSGFLAASPLDSVSGPLSLSPTDATVSAASIGEAPGSVVGRYRLVEPIGAGGFGEVFLAEQFEPVRRRVALKIIKLGMDTRQVIARFEAERQALALMEHPNIAKVLDAGATESGRPYFVMELVDGVPITAFCDHDAMGIRDRLALFVTVCLAIQHAHSKGLIHRDIKPSNVLVCRQDGEPAPRVIDFGIAKATHADHAGKTVLTDHRQMLGTPAYMSPEQAAPSGGEIQARSDVYSLGVLLYELLTGTTPFAERALREGGLAEMQRLIREVEPPKPSARMRSLGSGAAHAGLDDETRHDHEPHAPSPAEIARRRRAEPAGLSRLLRGDLDWIVMKAMDKDPARRFATARELAEDIQRFLADQPVLAGPPSQIYRMTKYIRRRRVGLTVGVIAALLATGITTLLFYGGVLGGAHLEAIHTIALLPLDDLSGTEGNEYFADGMTEALIGQLERLESLRVISGTSVMRYKHSPKSLADMGRELSADAIMRGTIKQTGDRVQISARLFYASTGGLLWSGSFDRKPQDVMELQNELARAIAQEIGSTLTPREQALLAARAHPVVPQAHDAFLKGRYYWNKRTQPGIERAIQCFQESIRIAPDYAEAYAGLADSYMLLTPYGNLPPDETYPRSRAAAERALQLDASLGQAHASLGVVLHEYDWKHAEAEAEFLRAIELSPNYAPARQWYAELLTRLGRHDEAIVQIDRARELDPLSLIVNSIVGWVYTYAGRSDQALRRLRETIDMEPDFVPAHGYLGMALEQGGDYAGAIQQYQIALELSHENPRYMSDIAVVQAQEGDSVAARKALAKLVPLADAEEIHAFLVARVCTALRDDEDALAWLDRGGKQRGVWMLFLNIDPLFKPLRGDARFHELLRRVGLE